MWVLQGWMFRNRSFWTLKRARALLSHVPRGRLLVLDTSSATDPQFNRLESYFGHSFVYCMLHNYGGTLGLYGKADTINRGPAKARNNFGSMAGVGMTPEGIGNSFVAYELMGESFWRENPVANLSSWVEEYSVRRYGKEDQDLKSAWNILLRTAYNCCEKLDRNSSKPFRFHGRSAVSAIPSLKMKIRLWYRDDELVPAWDSMISASKKKWSKGGGFSAFRHDLIDVSRQAVANFAHRLYKRIVKSYSKESKGSLEKNSKFLLRLMKDLDTLLGTDENFLVGKWLRDARRGAKSRAEAAVREYNTRNQVRQLKSKLFFLTNHNFFLRLRCGDRTGRCWTTPPRSGPDWCQTTTCRGGGSS